MRAKPLKIGLLGTTGVGKDTCCQCIKKLFPNISIQVLRLAQPLYAVQNMVYQICGVEKGGDIQDGALLNFLGKHMRQINPQVLVDAFFDALRKVGTETDLILCPDVRPIDAPSLKKIGFTLIHILADPETALERRKKRGDLTLGQATHETESGLIPEACDAQIVNNGTFEELEGKLRQILQIWL